MPKSHNIQVFNESFSSIVFAIQSSAPISYQLLVFSWSIHSGDFSSSCSIGVRGVYLLDNHVAHTSSSIWVPLSNNNRVGFHFQIITGNNFIVILSPLHFKLKWTDTLVLAKKWTSFIYNIGVNALSFDSLFEYFCVLCFYVNKLWSPYLFNTNDTGNNQWGLDKRIVTFHEVKRHRHVSCGLLDFRWVGDV